MIRATSLVVLLGLVSLAPATAGIPPGTLTTLHNFSALNSGFENADGARPNCSLIRAANNGLYGTAVDGGLNGNGVIFKVNAYGAYTTVHTFAADDGNYKYSNSDGSHPVGSLVLASDGDFYGTTYLGGEFGTGTVYKMTESGVVTVLHSFSSLDSQLENAEGVNPNMGLVQNDEGGFYGTTSEGGAYGHGTVFKMTSTGDLTTLHSFYSMDGVNPAGQPLIRGNNGSYYGMTFAGGINNEGTIFKIEPSGAFESVYSFTSRDSSEDNINGANPTSLVQADNNYLYGTAEFGGVNGTGTVFKLTLSGSISTVYAFPSVNHKIENFYGACPSSLIQARDGVFYGTTESGGDNAGTIFKINYGGLLKNLYTFDGTDGHDPSAALLQVGERGFYGTVSAGGTNGLGTIFRLTLGK